MRICVICDSVYPDNEWECRDCKDGGELIELLTE